MMILLVEDEALSAMYMKIQIERMGFRVQALSTGEEAVSLALRERPDLILMDINLSGKMSGIEAARLIKAEFEVPLIFITGYSDENTREFARELKPSAFLVKPLDMKDLGRRLRALLGPVSTA